ncbi:TetR family transcriptional regulator [Streptomyces sp. PKU-EA00015]|uniref:TetR family transcriptional regulator n=1 Tax=Streptomyces sp. PKU-EA00015 TaxID=2748326 RepID=UPI0015A0C712|nr:TetR family transcriptional regulator [Streptomyces sp. PKU-EA00015]NWF29993.1 TetR family transcriptional regulator [Streptomyces sp. PKU-EA00015]
MPTETLTAERILEATEEVLRRYGPAKATVVDVARALGVSHGSVYRHFRTKAALREAVTDRWLARAEVALAALTEARERTAPQKVADWLSALFEAKRHKAGDDPELFATYGVLIDENSGVVDRHLEVLIGQLRQIVEEGVRTGDFTADDPAATARALFDATTRFHDPAYAPEWRKPTVDAEFDAVVGLLLRGLRA